MKKYFSFIAVAISLLSQPVFSQEASDSTLLGLPGDNLDLYAVLDLFQKSKTIEDFEKSLNDQKTGINNLDLDLDKKVDFIKVVTKQKDSSFTFILQDAVSEKETQDVAVILVDKDKDGKVTMQIVGDEELYGKDYVVEPKPSVTVNPGYTGSAPVTAPVVKVESAPVVQYVYSPVYVPYVPPYYYGYYPPYYAAFTVMAIGIYHSNHYYHGGYGYHNTVVIHNHNNYNNYNGNRNHSDRVSHNNSNGRYNNGNRPTTRPSTGNSASTRPSTGQASTNRRSDGSSAGAGASTMDANRGGNNNRAGNGMSRSSNRQSPSNMSSPRGGRSMGSGGFGGGGGNRSGGGFGGGRGGGGGGRRR